MRRVLIAAVAALALGACASSDGVSTPLNPDGDATAIYIGGSRYKLYEVRLPNGDVIHCLKGGTGQTTSIACWLDSDRN